ncbi:transglutaminaseTgpA domain-containing protein, partial [uncultured Arthrobacter sp.]|uniref:transglutaminaseTgpA domain-containing protein n=1 Tax=uncultured Arthrobacter sp. TaxID=114050 RepID=UPI00321718F8
MSTATPLRPRNNATPAKRSGFADGQPLWHLALDAGALTVLLGLGVLGFSLSFGGDPYYLIAGFGGVLLGLALAAATVHFRLGLLITAALTLGAYLVFGTALAVPEASFAGVLPTLDSLRTLLLGVVFAWKDMLTVGVPVGTAGGTLIVPFLSSLLTALAAGLLIWRLKSPYWPLLPVLVLFVTGIAFSTNAGFLTVERGISLTVVAIAWATFRRDALRRSDTRKVSVNRLETDEATARAAKVRRLGTAAAVIAVAVGITAVASPLVTASDDRRVLRNTIVPPFDPKDYVTPLASFRNFVKDKKDDTLFVVKGLPKDARVRLAALDSFNGTNYNMDPNGSGSFSKVGDAKSLNTLADSTGIVPSNNYTLDITVEDYQGYFLPGGRKTTGISFARDGSGAASGLYFNAGTDTAVTTRGLAKGDAYRVQVADPATLEHGQLTQYDFAKLSLPAPAEVPPVVGSQANDLAADAPARAGANRDAPIQHAHRAIPLLNVVQAPQLSRRPPGLSIDWPAPTGGHPDAVAPLKLIAVNADARPSHGRWPAPRRGVSSRAGSLGGRSSLAGRLRLEHRKHLLGKELQSPLRDLVRGAPEAEGDVELKVADDLAPLFEPAQDLVGGAPAGGLHEAVDGAFEAGLARDLRFLLVGVVALHGLEVVA